MKHQITVYTIVGNECREVAFWTDKANEIGIGGVKISVPDNICIVSFTKKTVILVTDSPRFKSSPNYTPDYNVNCVNAYDYNGNHLWNIAEIIGNVESNICYGHVCSTDYLTAESKDLHTEGHELFVCWDSNEIRYLIDLDEKKVIHKMMTR